jgi:hypothetical protein
MVSHDPDNVSTQFGRRWFHPLTQPPVRVVLGDVREISGENESVNLLVTRAEAVENVVEVFRDVDPRKQFSRATEKVSVRDVGDDVGGVFRVDHVARLPSVVPNGHRWNVS